MTSTRALLIIVLAVFFDGLQMFTQFFANAVVAATVIQTLGITGIMTAVGVVLNWIISACAWLTFYILFKMWGFSGMGINSGFSSMTKLAIAFGFELIPFGNNFPGWTGWAIYTVAEGLARKTVKKIVPGGDKALGKIAEAV